jgi:hypothetical protein
VIATPSAITLNVDNCQWMKAGIYILISDGTNDALCQVQNTPVFPFTQVSVLVIPQDSSAIGNTINTGAVVIPGALNGSNGWTTLTQALTIPNLSSPNVNINVGDANWAAAGQIIIVADSSGTGNFGHFQVTSAVGTMISANFLNLIGDAVPGTVLPISAKVSPSGNDGIGAYGTTTANFVLPAANGSVTATVKSSAMFVVGEYVLASDGTNIGNLKVTAVSSPTTVTMTWLDLTGDSVTGTTILSGAKIIPVGQPAATVNAVVSDAAGYTTTGIVTGANFGPAGGWNIPAGTLVNPGDSISIEVWILCAVNAGNKTYVLNFGGTPIFTFGPAGVTVNTVFKIAATIALKTISPYAQLALVTNIEATVTTSTQVSTAVNTSVATSLTMTISQTAGTDSSTLLYIRATATPV